MKHRIVARYKSASLDQLAKQLVELDKMEADLRVGRNLKPGQTVSYEIDSHRRVQSNKTGEYAFYNEENRRIPIKAKVVKPQVMKENCFVEVLSPLHFRDWLINLHGGGKPVYKERSIVINKGPLYDVYLKRKDTLAQMEKLKSSVQAPVFVDLEHYSEWLAAKARQYGSQIKFFASPEFDAIRDEVTAQVKALKAEAKNRFKDRALQDMQEKGIQIGDKVGRGFGPIFFRKYLTGTVIMRGGVPQIKLDPEAQALTGRVFVRWDRSWDKSVK